MKRIVKIHKEGLRFIIVIFALLAVVVALISIHVEQVWIHYILYAIAIAFFYFVVRFFRVPNREIVKNDKAIYALADGKIVVIEEIDEDCYFHDRRLQISIFMSPLNVHVNSYPISGRVVKSDYYPGKHLVAWYPKSSELNEHTNVCLRMSVASRFLSVRWQARWRDASSVTPRRASRWSRGAKSASSNWVRGWMCCCLWMSA